jgi:hypothetical protein
MIWRNYLDEVDVGTIGKEVGELLAYGERSFPRPIPTEVSLHSSEAVSNT